MNKTEEKMNKTLKISLILNLVNFSLVVLGVVVMLTGFQFMGEELILSARKIEAFRFFTVDSNILAGVASLIFAVYEIGCVKGKFTKIPRAVIVLKYVATVGVALTMFTVIFFLAPFVAKSYPMMFKNSNLFFHLIVPLVSLVSFLFFEPMPHFSRRTVLWGPLPMFVYSVFYTINALLHIEDGTVSMKYDWYGFLSGGVKFAVPAFLLMLFGTALISAGIFFGNRALAKEKGE